jgi:hypothetical protein
LPLHTLTAAELALGQAFSNVSNGDEALSALRNLHWLSSRDLDGPQTRQTRARFFLNVRYARNFLSVIRLLLSLGDYHHDTHIPKREIFLLSLAPQILPVSASPFSYLSSSCTHQQVLCPRPSNKPSEGTLVLLTSHLALAHCTCRPFSPPVVSSAHVPRLAAESLRIVYRAKYVAHHRFIPRTTSSGKQRVPYAAL